VAAPLLLWGTLAAMVLSGCSSAHYRRSADKEVYQIIQQVENHVFGKTNAFTIDTAYSPRKPEEILPNELIDDRLRTNQRTLTIEGALELAVTSSRRYQNEKERLYLTALTLTGERYQFSPQFFANSTASLNRSEDGERSASISSQAGVSQLLKTGGLLSAKLANDILRYYTGDPRRSVLSAVSVDLFQPLLRGFGRNNAAVESLTQAERNVIYAIRNFQFFQDDFALEIVNDYIALLAQKDNIRNRYTNYLGRVQSTQRLEARVVDRESLSGVDQARQAELGAKNNYINAVATYQNALDQFKIKLGLSLGEKLDLDDQALKEVEQIGLIPAPFDAEQAYRLAVQKQLQVLNEIDRFEDLKRKIRVAANGLKADLNLFANASLNSDPPTDYTKFDPDKIRAGVGLELNLPIDRLRERNNYRATLVSFEAELRNLTLTLDTLKDNIQRGVRTLDQRRQNYQIQTNALEVADRRVESTTLLQQAGRAEVRDVVESQDAQIAAQTAVIAGLVAYQEARLQLMLDIGALDTELQKFWLKDHLAGFFPRGVVAAKAPPTNEPILPPEQFFKN
jgi:outer membrane protein TolC